MQDITVALFEIMRLNVYLLVLIVALRWTRVNPDKHHQG